LPPQQSILFVMVIIFDYLSFVSEFILLSRTDFLPLPLALLYVVIFAFMLLTSLRVTYE